MCKIVAILTFLCFVHATNCTTSFDQRQTGDLNIQIGLKNIQLIALLNSAKEEYVDYDYAYDYSEMTIKPQYGTTQKPLNVTNTQSGIANSSSTALTGNTTETYNTSNLGLYIHYTTQNINDLNITTKPIVNIIASGINISESSNNVTQEGAGSSNNNIETLNMLSSAVVFNQTANVVHANLSEQDATGKDKIATKPSTTVFPANDENTTVSPSNCRRGFVKNNQGKCVYKIHGTSNGLRRIVKLAQKIKIGRGLTET